MPSERVPIFSCGVFMALRSAEVPFHIGLDTIKQKTCVAAEGNKREIINDGLHQHRTCFQGGPAPHDSPVTESLSLPHFFNNVMSVS